MVPQGVEGSDNRTPPLSGQAQQPDTGELVERTHDTRNTQPGSRHRIQTVVSKTVGWPAMADDTSRWSLWSEHSVLSVASRHSALSIGSDRSFASIGSVGSAFSLASVGSFASVLGIGSALSVAAILSFRSRRAILRANHLQPDSGRLV
jgi:hypothetical protein